MVVKTLGHRVAELDEERFTGRGTELELLGRLLDDDAPERVVLLHGPGGIGKSTLVRELVRRAARAGFTPYVVDGRELVPVPGEIERRVAGVRGDERALLVLDSYERMAAADDWVRRVLLPSLPEPTRTVLAGRRLPSDGWFADGWEHLVVDVELRPLPPDDARALLAAHGLDDDALAPALARWAQGLPLALVLGARAAGRPGGLVPDRLDEDHDLLGSIVARVARAEIAHGNLDAIAVAAIARSCDRRMLADVLPGTDGAATEVWLRELTFAEPVGDGVSLHELVRRALRTEVRARDPERERQLRRRIADHLYRRALQGEPRLLVDLAELIEDPAVRWALGAEGSAEYRVDSLRDRDLAVLEDWYAGRPEWWAGVARFLAEAPTHVVVARDAHDELAGASIAVTLTGAPAFAAADALLGPWLAHARASHPSLDVLLWRETTDLMVDSDPSSPVISLMNTAAVLRSGLTNVRLSYLPLQPADDQAMRFAARVGATPCPELAVELDGRRFECHIVDHGPGGIIGAARGMVYAEIEAPGGGAALSAATADDVRDALRNFHRPDVLAHSPLAADASPEARAETVRTRLGDAVVHAFGVAPDELLLRAVVERGYLDPGSKHDRVAAELHLSRTAYFRRLRRASERIAAWVLEHDGR
jgi:hypothetical protein